MDSTKTKLSPQDCIEALKDFRKRLQARGDIYSASRDVGAGYRPELAGWRQGRLDARMSAAADALFDVIMSIDPE
jgi:hypothetical protein